MLQYLNKRKVPLVTTISYLYIHIQRSYSELNRIGGVMISVLASSAVERGFEPRSGQTKDYVRPVSVHLSSWLFCRRQFLPLTVIYVKLRFNQASTHLQSQHMNISQHFTNSPFPTPLILVYCQINESSILCLHFIFRMKMSSIIT